MKWKYFCVLTPLLALAGAALAAPDSIGPTDPNAAYNYAVPPQIPPTIDATNFDIENSFTINFGSYNVNTLYYEPSDTINFTNNGTMMANTGFRFDTQISGGSQHVPAANFYNAGSIYCGSTLDTYQTVFAGYGQILVSATNVINPGTLDVGVGGKIQISGQNVDLSRSTLTVESLFATNNLYNIPTLSSYGAAVRDPYGWNPYYDLTALKAYSPSLPPGYSSQMILTNLAVYSVVNLINPTNYILYRSVFIQNASTNIPCKVYFDNANNSSQLGIFGLNGAHVEWDGVYLDDASGNYFTNYLYLSDNYLLSATTNDLVFGGVPENFTFATSQTPLIFLPPATTGLVNYPNQDFTNRYAYMYGTLVPGSTITNASPTNPSGAITNIPGRIQISATNILNLTQAVITGPNYMSLVCSNQFAGSPGAYVATPYSDVNLGVTNGFLTVSNLLVGSLPQWSGTIQAWSTQWYYVDANGVTNDYRVMLVYDNLQPVSPPWIQNLRLHATNSLVVSDVLNIYGSLYADAQSLTLATNQVGTGATSLDGELNFDTGSTLATLQLPNLVWLTNNGAIRSLNNANFTNVYTGFTYVSTNYLYRTNAQTLVVTTNVAGVATNRLPANWLGAFINNSLITNQAMAVDALNFTNNGGINSGSGTFVLQASSANLVNGYTLAGSDITLTGTNMLLAGEYLNAGRALNLRATAQLTDGASNLVVNGLTNGNVWVVGANGIGGADSGFNAPYNPLNGDFLGTTVTNIAPAAKSIVNTWSGVDRGINVAGYANNLAVGHLVLDAFGTATRPGTFSFVPASGTNNALYVDCLELRDYATNIDGSYNPVALTFPPNFVIYYAQAYINGFSVAEKINHKGLDTSGGGDHLRWVASYAGYFSYTNLVYPNGTTNAVNLALATSSDIASGGNLSGPAGPNLTTPTQIFVPSEIGLNITLTNRVARRLAWTIPATATNYSVQYATNLLSLTWTNLVNWAVTNAQPTVANAQEVETNTQGFVTNAPVQFPLVQTNVIFLDTNSGPMRFYRVVIQPWWTYPR